MIVHRFEFPKAWTYGRTDKPGESDSEKREYIREAASKSFPAARPVLSFWGFRIIVRRNKNRRNEFDIENVPKLIVDAFCERQFKRWDVLSKYGHLVLYENDTIDTVRLLQIFGERTGGPDSTSVEIHGWTDGQPILIRRVTQTSVLRPVFVRTESQ